MADEHAQSNLATHQTIDVPTTRSARVGHALGFDDPALNPPVTSTSLVVVVVAAAFVGGGLAVSGLTESAPLRVLVVGLAGAIGYLAGLTVGDRNVRGWRPHFAAATPESRSGAFAAKMVAGAALWGPVEGWVGTTFRSGLIMAGVTALGGLAWVLLERRRKHRPGGALPRP